MSKSFSKWWAKVPAEYTDVVSEDVARSAYTAGMERAAEILSDYFCDCVTTEEIATKKFEQLILPKTLKVLK